MPAYSRAHTALKALVETSRHGTMANALGISTNSLRGILLGAVPKVTVAVTIARVLDIPIADWLIPIEDKLEPTAAQEMLNAEPTT